MHIISLFNNKGGVGKTTLAYHLACALAALKKRVLMIDLDPQCNLTVCSMRGEDLHQIWEQEDDYISDFENARKRDISKFEEVNSTPRSIHFLLKPTEEGTGELDNLPPALHIRDNLDLIPGRLTLYTYEHKISERWNGVYLGEALSIRTITRIRTLAVEYGSLNNYDYIIIDTSPSLGALNKIIISTVDGFIVPCLPDMFSLYGIRNIGNSLSQWKREFETIYQLISNEKRKYFPSNFVQFLGYTIYNARKYTGVTPWDLATAHYDYARRIPETIEAFITADLRKHLTEAMIREPIGETAVMHSHNTFPGASQKYNLPIWDVPNCNCLENEDKPTIFGNRQKYEETKNLYVLFTTDLVKRVERLGQYE